MATNKSNSRREFIRMLSLSGLGIGVAGSFAGTLPPGAAAQPVVPNRIIAPQNIPPGPDVPFVPRRVASWWCTLEDLLWSQKKITDKIKRRAAGFAEADIDTAVSFGFHIRFDFANYFGQLHGYLADVREELHQYNIKFIEHYSCNHVERPRGEAEFRKLHKRQRHHTLLFHDPVAAKHAQYEGHLFHDLCETDIRDGSRGYALQYQMETFCHNNPGFLDMHRKYLERLEKEVGHDGYQVDDMCNYAGLTTCGCKYCRERFRRDYGHEIPPFEDKSFFGDTSKPMLQWGNYENPAFRDWLKMKDDSIADHVQMVKSVIGRKPLMTCCSSTGPIVLNAISLNLERIAKHVDFFMLENVGTNIRCVDWMEKDAEALQQKDIAEKRGHSPAIALSYTIYEEGGYLGWSLARFWGVANWISTLEMRLEEDPVDAASNEDVARPSNNWEKQYSDLDYMEGKDIAEVRLAYNNFCKANGWKGPDGKEHWTKVREWSEQFIEHNTGYRFVRYEELADADALCAEETPLVLDSMGCVSDPQFHAISTYLSKNGTAWLVLPFGTHDEKGFRRKSPLSETLLKKKYRGLHIVKTAALEQLISEGKFSPAIRQTAGDRGWAIRARDHKGKTVLHFMNTAMKPVPHPDIRDMGNVPILKQITSAIQDNRLQIEIDTAKIPLSSLHLLSPETGGRQTPVEIRRKNNGMAVLQLNLENMKIYAVAQ
ncbi:hypothetical protein [Chitinophaga cymbidii]|uniref:Beta-galactosidase trimerisation domain-containing protein n=1 Tax=Chitinophaga cymbidii TaxID=1096750 RepID=A0A512RME9_9BACT|nr:hypothetical protein [Chitinophaga cymbidii]GEP96884.1 hypothetical protein CCY01nite_31440 [Chitinophaga cymbidii]